MKDPKYVVKQRKHRNPKLNNPEGWNGKVSLKNMPIYPKVSESYTSLGYVKYLELGDGYWLEMQQGWNVHRWYTLHHRQDNGRSMTRSIDIENQCVTCKEYMLHVVQCVCTSHLIRR